MNCEHDWQYVRIVTEDARKVDGEFKSVTISKWICKMCGKPRTLEYWE